MNLLAMTSYSLPALMLAPMAITFYVFLPKLYSDLGTVSVQAIGIAILITRIFDAITDPLIGQLSDSTKSRWGRRKPWMVYSLLPLCVCFILLLSVRSVPAAGHLPWFLFLSLGFFLFWTMFSVPYEAWGQELIQDYDRRTTLFAVRDGAVVLGTLLAAAAPIIGEFLLPSWELWTRWFTIALVYSGLLVLFTLICVRRTSNGIAVSDATISSSNVLGLSSWRTTLANVYFRRLIIAYTVGAFGAALPATLFLLYVERLLKSDQGPFFLALYFLIGMVTLPAWTKLSLRWGKKKAWIAAMMVNSGGFLGVFFLSAGDELAYGILIAISALGYGASLALPSAMQADVIDAEEVRVGTRKEGEFLGIWAVARKLSAAVGAGLGLWLLGAVGFDPSLTEQEPQVLTSLKTLYCVVPCLCNCASIWTLRNYSLNREEHAAIVAQLEQSRSLSSRGAESEHGRWREDG